MSEGSRLTTRLNTKWMFKMFVFLAFLLGLGVWAAIDAFWVYPKQGRHHAEYALGQHLECLSKSGRLLVGASVEDPAATLSALEASGAKDSNSCDAYKYAWLLSLSRVTSLSAISERNRAAIAQAGGTSGVNSETMFADPQATLDGLVQKLGTQNAPKPLAAYDIPLQYLFMIIGFGGAAWLAVFLSRCRTVSYSYDPSEHRLFLPDGRSFVPAQIGEVDKRDWHKYFIYLTLNDGSKEMKFDLLRYTPLEDWVLEMEKLHPNYEPPPPEEDEDEAESEVLAEGDESDEESDEPESRAPAR